MGADQELSLKNTSDDEPEVPTERPMHSGTRHLILTVCCAPTKNDKLLALHGLLHHLHLNPESRIDAVKENAVSVLLKLRHTTRDSDILSLVEEALCLLGYVDPPRGCGIRILAIDGGGVRGIVPIKLMMKLEELTQRPIYQLFDYVCGVSTGAILACSIFPQKRSLDEVLVYYKDLSKQVFQSNKLSGIARLVSSHGYYNTSKWEELLQDHFGNTRMIHTSRDKTCPKLSVISTAVNAENSPFIFRNYEFRHSRRPKYYGSSEYSLWEAVRASSAAPGYFREFYLGNYLHQDGGLTANNPCGKAIMEAQLLWPDEAIQCVVSLGTGKSKDKLPTKTVPSSSSLSDKWKLLVDGATDTEAIHEVLSSLLPEDKYYRFNPCLTEMMGLSEINSEKLQQLERDADMYYLQNENKFKAAAQRLLELRSIKQRLGDWINLRFNMMGFKANL